MTILTCTPVYMAYTLSIYRYIHHIHDDTDIYPCVYGIYTIYRYIHHIHTVHHTDLSLLYMVYTLYTGIYTIYKTILTGTPLYLAYTLYTGIYAIYKTILTSGVARISKICRPMAERAACARAPLVRAFVEGSGGMLPREIFEN